MANQDMENFGKYLLVERLAAGGMAEVYLAKLESANGINKLVAVKRILPQYSENPEFVEMFKEEAKIAVNLNHSNIVSIYEFGIEKKAFYLVMEFVEGQNMRQILNHMKKEGKDLSLDQIVYLIKEVAAGLDHAHRCLDSTTARPLNITHRDMSPQNVMVSFEGEVKIVDFGIAKAETQMEHTRAGTIKGKFGYMSPEQADGRVAVDPRTDIFSLGIILWELLARDRLFTAANEAATLAKVRECQIPSLRKINPNIPPELERICMKALAKDKSLRYQTAAAFHKDLNRFLNTQFPEFSTQEFSKYMKSLFHKMYLENRRKFAEYARMSNQDNDKTSVTATATLTNTQSAAPPPPPPPPRIPEEEGHRLEVDVQSKHIDLNNLKQQEVAAQAAARAAALRRQTQTGVRPGTQTGIRSGTVSRIQIRDNSSNNNFLYGAMAVVTLLGGLYFMKFKKSGEAALVETTKVTRAVGAPSNGSEDLASRQLVPINIQSRPQGATVLINGQNVGFTPYIGNVESGKEFSITIRKDGFLPYDRPAQHAGPELFRLEATLQPEPPMGYISIEVMGDGGDSIITVNGQRIDDKTQLVRYPVPANVPVRVQAKTPFANAAAEEIVTVGQSQKKAVRLILKRQATK